MKPLTVLQKSITVTDHAATGSAARAARTKAGLSLREVARRLGLSAPFISDLERGKRNWNEARILAYMQAIKLAE